MTYFHHINVAHLTFHYNYSWLLLLFAVTGTSDVIGDI